MADLDALKSMLNNFINDKPEEATMDLHTYITSKTREVAGLDTTPEVTDTDLTVTDDDPFNPEVDLSGEEITAD
jgi:hypothetical protein